MCHPRSSERRGESGFTMIEALVALSLFGIGMLALMQLAPRASHSGNQAHMVSQAMSLAQAKVEELRALPETNGELAAGTHDDTADLSGYLREWTVTDDTPITGMKQVTVRVSFETLSADSVATISTYF